MIKNIASEMTEQETEILIYALAKLVDYFHLNYYDTKEDSQYIDWAKIKQKEDEE